MSGRLLFCRHPDMFFLLFISLACAFSQFGNLLLRFVNILAALQKSFRSSEGFRHIVCSSFRTSPCPSIK